MPVLDVLGHRNAQVFLHDLGRAKRVWTSLHAVELCGQDAQGVVGAVADEESQVNQFVGVRELADEVKVL